MSVPELSFLVLTSLADQPRHGYGILQEIKAMTDGDTAPAVASLYRTIDRLTGDGLVEEAGNEVVDGRFRRIHRLTDDGRTVLAAEAEQRAGIARLAFRRLGQRPSPDPGPANQAGGPILGGSMARPRFGVAAMLLLGPITIVGMIRSVLLVKVFPGPFLLLGSAMVLLAVGATILGTAAPWLNGGRTSHTGGRA